MLLNLGLGIIAITALLLAVFSYRLARQAKENLKKSKEEMDRRVYELAILKELAERTGYSLNVEKIVDIITGSLSQFIEYSTVAYMLLEPEQVVFKMHLEKSVSRRFADEVKERMLKSLSALLEKEIAQNQVTEILSGAILVDEVLEPVRSFFNIPLVIGGKVVGVLTVAHTVPGLYKEEEMTILYKITQQAASAVTRLEEVVQIEERKLNAMVASMAEGVVMTDRDYRIVVANPAARHAVDLPSEKEVTIFDFIDRLGGKFDIRGKLEESVKLDRVLISQEVELGGRFFQIIASPVKSVVGLKSEVLGGVVVFYDITHEKEVERMREDFTSMMVHELRSPLDGIKKIVELMRSSAKKVNKEKYQEYTKIIYQSSGQMLELVNDLLDVAKIEAGKFEISKDWFDVRDLVAGRHAFYITSAKDAGLTLKMQVADDVPEKVWCDAHRLTQVLNNLISNALKFTPPKGSVELQVFIRKSGQSLRQAATKAGLTWRGQAGDEAAKDSHELVVVAVTDSGIGLSEHKVSRVFDKYHQFRAAAVNEEKRGTGLGLAIAKGIVEAHGGIIGVSSEEGVGSTFYFTIPLTTQEINN